MSSFKTHFKNIDIFGQSIQFTFDKKYKFKSITGAIFTIILSIVLSTVGVNGLIRLHRHEVKQLTTDFNRVSLNDENAFAPGKVDFAMAFGFEGVK